MNYQEKTAAPAYRGEGCIPEPPQTPVASELNVLRQAQETTSELVDELRARLNPALSAGIGSAMESWQPKAASPSLSPLHGDIYSAGDRQQALNARLRDLIERLVI